MMSSSENQASSLYRELIIRLQSGVIVPGDYLREQQVSEEFGVSRTPVREALRKLETEGLLVSEPRLGMRVRVLDYAEVIELYEVREVHERAVARIARAVETMQRTMLVLGPSTLADSKRAGVAIKEHRALIKALEKRDADKAESIMSTHLQNAQRSRIRQYQKEPWGV